MLVIFRQKIKNFSKNQGFSMVVAVVTTSIMLVVSLVVINVAVKQLILAYDARQSQIAYFNAESGLECALYWDVKRGPISAFDATYASTAPVCNNIQLSTTPGAVIGGEANSNFTLNLPTGCVVVSITKNVGSTLFNSRGYNTCAAGAQRKFERGIKIQY